VRVERTWSLESTQACLRGGGSSFDFGEAHFVPIRNYDHENWLDIYMQNANRCTDFTCTLFNQKWYYDWRIYSGGKGIHYSTSTHRSPTRSRICAPAICMPAKQLIHVLRHIPDLQIREEAATITHRKSHSRGIQGDRKSNHVQSQIHSHASQQWDFLSCRFSVCHSPP